MKEEDQPTSFMKRESLEYNKTKMFISINDDLISTHSNNIILRFKYEEY